MPLKFDQVSQWLSLPLCLSVCQATFFQRSVLESRASRSRPLCKLTKAKPFPSKQGRRSRIQVPLRHRDECGRTPRGTGKSSLHWKSYSLTVTSRLKPQKGIFVVLATFLLFKKKKKKPGAVSVLVPVFRSKMLLFKCTHCHCVERLQSLRLSVF